MVQLTFVYLCLPTLLLAAPLEDGLKQQIAAGLLRNDESQWNFLSPAEALLELQQRSLDSLGRGHILRSIPEGEGNWFGGNTNRDNNYGWRFNGYSGGLKRGSGLDSLGQGNILRSIPSSMDEFQVPAARYLKSLDSLGRGNILKRSPRIAA